VAFNYDWIINGLAQGNFPGTPQTAFKDFDVVMLCAEEHQPRWKVPGGKFTFKLPLDDDPYRQVPLDVGRVVVKAAHAAGTYHAAGHPLLTTCHMGHNRSGICTALVLIMFYQMDPGQAINLIRKKRNNDCIGNPMFEQFLYNWQAYR
jgi:protein-tyrosine phosphatase